MHWVDSHSVGFRFRGPIRKTVCLDSRLSSVLHFRDISRTGFVVIHKLFVPGTLSFCCLRFGSSLEGLHYSPETKTTM